MEFSSNRLKQVHSRCTTSGLVELLQNHEAMFLSVKQTRMAIISNKQTALSGS